MSLSWSIMGLLPLYTVSLYEVHWHNSHLSWALSSAVNIIHSSLQSLLSLFSLYFNHCCSLSLFFYAHLSLFWCRSKFFLLLSIWLHKNSNVVATNHPLAFIQWRNLCFLLLLQQLILTFSRVWRICIWHSYTKSMEVVASSYSRNWIRSEIAKCFSTDLYKLQ